MAIFNSYVKLPEGNGNMMWISWDICFDVFCLDSSNKIRIHCGIMLWFQNLIYHQQLELFQGVFDFLPQAKCWVAMCLGCIPAILDNLIIGGIQ